MPNLTAMRLPRAMRMTSRSEFARVRREGKSFAGRFIVLAVLPSPQLAEPFKFGLILTRKVGNAVTRNRVRRRLRALLSEFGEAIAPPCHLVAIARYTAPDASYQELRRDWKKLAGRAGILSHSEAP